MLLVLGLNTKVMGQQVGMVQIIGKGQIPDRIFLEDFKCKLEKFQIISFEVHQAVPL